MSKTEEASITVLMVPDWCKKMPKSDLFIYACGIGNSSNLNMSNSRALLDGKAKLANQINGQITSRMTDLLEDLGENNNQVIQASERVIKSVTKETQVAGFKEVQSEFQNIGSKFQTYILLEYPIGEANQLLYNKIKNDNPINFTMYSNIFQNIGTLNIQKNRKILNKSSKSRGCGGRFPMISSDFL